MNKTDGTEYQITVDTFEDALKTILKERKTNGGFFYAYRESEDGTITLLLAKDRRKIKRKIEV